MIEPDTGTRGEAVAAWIRERIVNGELTPGTHLQEQAIGNLTGTSRTPVREALKLLQREQLVLYSPNRGYVVRRFSLKDILDAFDKAGIDIAYPTTTNFTAAPDGSMIMPYPEVKILAEEGHGDHDWAHTGQAAPEGRISPALAARSALDQGRPSARTAPWLAHQSGVSLGPSERL